MEKEQEQFENCLAELKSIENVILPQLNDIAQKIDAKYKAYADMVRNLGNMTMSVAKSDSSLNKIGTTTALLSRGIESYGAYKAAQKHNQKLDEMQALKQSIAAQKKKQISDWLPRISKNVEKSKHFCEIQYSKTYPLDSVSSTLVSFQLKFLNLYRTNLYYENLAQWMLKEYSSWLNGQQTCGNPAPTLLDINVKLGKSLYGTNLYNYYQRVVESDKSILGKDISLIADPQLTLLALDACEVPVEINPLNANPVISEILGKNEGIKYYRENVTEMCKSINNDPTYSWNCIALVFAIVFSLTLFLNRESLSTGAFWTTLIIGGLCTFRVWNRVRKKIYMTFLEGFTDLSNETDLSIMKMCGYIEQEEIDYEKKNAFSAAINQFINI